MVDEKKIIEIIFTDWRWTLALAVAKTAVGPDCWSIIWPVWVDLYTGAVAIVRADKVTVGSLWTTALNPFNGSDAYETIRLEPVGSTKL